MAGTTRPAGATSDTSGSPQSLGTPIEALIRLIRGRHKPDILICLGNRRHRFGELRRAIPRVSERVLARQLDELERDGLVARTVFAEVPSRVEYSLTPLGATLCPLLKQMWKWGAGQAPGLRE